MTDIFLSYSREDQAIARRFAEGFEREGLTVWWDQALRSGENYDQVTESALREAKAVVVLWSKQSVDSRWVRAEATQADRNGTLMPVMIEPCNRPIMFELKHTAELAHWKGEAGDPAWRMFLEDVRLFAKKGGSATPRAIAQSAPSRPMQFGVRTLLWIVGVLVVAAVVFWIASPPSKVASISSEAAKEVTLAVLPFADFSTAHDQDSFCDGLSEEILNQLAQVKGLAVTARTSSFSFKGKNEDMRVIAQKLGVANLLEGSIQKEGNQLRITAQLINGKTGTHLWSRTYPRERKDIFVVQDEIAKDVAQALSIKLDVGEVAAIPGMTRNVEAYEAYLAAQSVPLRFTRESQQRRIDLLLQATRLDPSFALAWQDLGFNYISMPSITQEDAQGWQQKAEAAFMASDRLLPDSAALQYRLAFGSISQGRWKEAAEHIATGKHAERKMFGTAAQSVAGAEVWLLVSVGKLAAARSELEQQKARNPLDQGTAWILGWVYGAAGEFPASFAEFERGDRLEGPEQFRIRTIAMMVAMGARDRAQILRWLDAAIAVAGQDAQLQGFAKLKVLLDRPAEALAYIETETRDPSHSRDTLPGMGNWIAYFGDNATALATLRRAFERGAVTTGLFLWGPALHDVRRQPGFKQLMRDYGFVEYWRAYGWGDFCKPQGEEDFECQ